jgi:AGZA family xanthine/uracil permease-like MFS transporter
MSTLLFVNGTLMRGLKLHGNLAGATFLGEFRTAPRYRVHSIGDIHPGMYEVERQGDGASIPGELYELPDEVWERVHAGEPPNLYRGDVMLEDGRVVPGILYPRALAQIHPDITRFGGWRGYMASREQRTRR